MKNYRLILGLDLYFEQDDVKNAYRKLAIKYHPDHNPNDKMAKEKFLDINEAYNVLSTKKGRQENFDNYINEITKQHLTKVSELERKIVELESRLKNTISNPNVAAPTNNTILANRLVNGINSFANNLKNSTWNINDLLNEHRQADS